MSNIDKYNALISKYSEKNMNKGILSEYTYTLKDNINVKGTKTTCASKALSNYESEFNATIFELLNAAGANLIGKANLDEFAMGIDNSTSYYKTVINPLNPERIVGGSSGGSAASVAGNLCDFSIGTDTGGSIRLPAAYTGLVAMKPTYGTVSRHGIVSLGSSFDQAGPITKTIDLNEKILNVIAKKDTYDLTSHALTNLNTNQTLELSKIKVGYFKNILDSASDDIKNKFFETIQKLKEYEVKVVEYDEKLVEYAPYAYYTILCGEVFSNFGRYDGIKYNQTNDILETNWSEYIKKYRTESFGYEVKKRILIGAFFLSEKQYDTYYLRGTKYRTLLIKLFEEKFKEVDFILSPTSLIPASKVGETVNAEKLFLTDAVTTIANLTGMPALAMPNGKMDNNLFSSLQISGNYFQEKNMYNFGKFIEKIYQEEK